MKAPDISKTPTLYVVPYAHLDTQWRWNFPQTISEYLLKTMRVNFDYMDKYPHYVFNWSGSNRYRLMKEYYPTDYARLQQYAAQGPMVPRRLVGRRRRRQPSQRRGAVSPVPLWQRILPQRSRQGQHRVHAARLLRFPRFVAHHSRPCRNKRILNAEAQFRLAARAVGRWSGFSGADSGRHSLQRRTLDTDPTEKVSSPP